MISLIFVTGFSMRARICAGYGKVGPLPREGSIRSSLSEMSGLSGASSRTYLNDASTLVLETLENGIKKYVRFVLCNVEFMCGTEFSNDNIYLRGNSRSLARRYYLVPLSLAQKNKWKKKGTKLHIYNEHTFVAKHLSG